MNVLSKYIDNRDIHIDGHIHLFTKDKYLFDYYDPKSIGINTWVGFADIELNDLESYNGHMTEIYKNYIKKHWNSSQILLATATTAKEAIEIYNKFPQYIKGFGEFKLYHNYRGEEVNLDKISEIRKICSFSAKHGNLPIYIHYSLINPKRFKVLNNLLRDFPTVPVVLCHCGIAVNQEDKEYAFNMALSLQHSYSNLWLDISFSGARYLYKNPLLMSNLIKERCFFGTDINVNVFKESNKDYVNDPQKYCEDQFKYINDLKEYIASDKNIKTLFKIK